MRKEKKTSKKCEHRNAKTLNQRIITTWFCLDCGKKFKTHSQTFREIIKKD